MAGWREDAESRSLSSWRKGGTPEARTPQFHPFLFILSSPEGRAFPA